jgi:hypothetical protein
MDGFLDSILDLESTAYSTGYARGRGEAEKKNSVECYDFAYEQGHALTSELFHFRSFAESL